MSNPGLLRLLNGGLSQFHVGRRDRGHDPYPVFNGEMRTFSAYVNETHDFQKKSNREEGKDGKDGKDNKKRKKSGGDSSSDDESDSEGPNFKSSGIHAKGSDADGDGKKNESKKKKKFKDSNKNGKVDAFEEK